MIKKNRVQERKLAVITENFVFAILMFVVMSFVYVLPYKIWPNPNIPLTATYSLNWMAACAFASIAFVLDALILRKNIMKEFILKL